MLSARVLRGVRSGEIGVVFFRWGEPLLEPGSRLVTPVGLVGVESVRRVGLASIDEPEARLAGFSSAAGLRSMLAERGSGSVFRVGLRYLGPAGREESERDRPVVLSSGERDRLVRELARLDVSAARGGWTWWVLELVGRRPGVRVAEVAAEWGRPVARCKSDVWRLRQLGLVEPVPGGVRLSAVGRALLQG
nr:hypothetical protein [Saccharopolyspora sp. HNM0983]